MNDRQESLAWGLIIGGAVIWWMCRRRRWIGLSGAASSSGGCGCHSSASAGDRAMRLCPPQGQTSFLFNGGYSQAPGYEYTGAYGSTGQIQPVVSPAVVPVVPPGAPRSGVLHGDRFGYAYGYGGIQ